MQRDKALEMALGQIEKQYGKGAVMRMDEQAKVKIACIPTGALSLDLALGIGGLPRGRVVEVYGPEGSGKCVVGDTYLWTDRGLETIAELFERCGQKASCTSRVTDIRHLGVRAVNERGELEQIAALTHNNRHPVLRLRLTSGRTLSVTHNHPLRVINDQGYIAWRKAEQIAQGDTVVSASFGAVEAADGDGLTEDEAALLGYLVAAGSLSSPTTVRFTNRDREVGDDFTGLMEGLFGVEVRCYDRKAYAAHSKAIRSELAQRYDLDYVDAGGTKVPACVRTGGAKVQRAFLSALFEGDGWIDTSSTVGIGSASEQLAREVQLMLYGFGIPATVSSSFDTTDERDYWTVTVNPASAHRFLDEIGFRSARRQAQVAASFRRSTIDPAEGRYTYEQVTAVEDGGVQPTFDIVLPGTHSFVANGVVSHNTTVALHAIAEAQKAGGIAAFIDAEHALDPSYASALGVDIEALLVSQPDNGEQALEIADMLIRSNAIDILVVDSVAALTPRAEIEGEMGDSHVGLQARLMSQALRKLAGTLNRSRTCAVFVNQIREKIGVMFGSPETQPGGRALKFYSSVRLDVRRIESLKDGTDFVGNRVRVKVVKNKCVAAGTRISDPTTGTSHAIEDIVDRGEGSAVWAADKRGELHVRPIRARMDQGQQEVIGLGLCDGTELRVTPDHLILTETGWQVAGELSAGDRVARPRSSRAVTAGSALGDPHGLLSVAQTEPVVDRLRQEGVAPAWVASLLDLPVHEADAGMQELLGGRRLRRSRVEALAQALDSAFLREVLADELYYDPLVSITPARWERTFDLEVEDLHNFVADDVVVHNCAPPFRQAEFDIMFGEGISKEGSVLDVGVEHGIVKKAGAWYTYDGEQLGQGRENARSFLKEHGEVTAEIYKKVTEALGLVPTDVTGDDTVPDDVAPGTADR